MPEKGAEKLKSIFKHSPKYSKYCTAFASLCNVIDLLPSTSIIFNIVFLSVYKDYRKSEKYQFYDEMFFMPSEMEINQAEMLQ